MSDRKFPDNRAARTSSDRSDVRSSAASSDVVVNPNSMLVDEQRYTYLPLGDASDPRVILMRQLGTPADLMGIVWRCAMRVQGAVQNSVFEITRAVASGDDIDRDKLSAAIMGFAIGIGIAARNCHLSNSGFAGLVKVATDAGNLVDHTDDIRRLAEANGHATADTTIN